MSPWEGNYSGRQKDPLRTLTLEEQAALDQVSCTRSEPASQVARAKMVLAVAGGQSYTAARVVGLLSGAAQIGAALAGVVFGARLALLGSFVARDGAAPAPWLTPGG